MRFGAFYRLGMKAVMMAGSFRVVSQSWRRLLSVKLACQRRDGVKITVSWTGCSPTLGGSAVDEGGGVIAERSDFEEA